MGASQVKNAIDLSALLFHAALEEQFPALMNQAARSEQAAASVQDLLWALASAKPENEVEIDLEDLRPFTTDPALRNFARKVIGGDLSTNGGLGRGWSGAAFVGSSAAFVDRIRSTRGCDPRGAPVSWRDELLPKLVGFLDSVEKGLLERGDKKRLTVERESKLRRTISDLCSLDSKGFCQSSEDSAKALTSAAASLRKLAEGPGTTTSDESLFFEGDAHLDIEITDIATQLPSPNEIWIDIPPECSAKGALSIGPFHLLIDPESVADREVEVFNTKLLDRISDFIPNHASSPELQQTENPNLPAAPKLEGILRLLTAHLKISANGLSALSLETLCSLAEISLALSGSSPPLTQNENALEEWIKQLDQFSDGLADELPEHRGHFVRHFAFVNGFLSRSASSPKSDSRHAELIARTSELAERELARIRTHGRSRGAARRQIVEDYYRALLNCYTQRGANHPCTWSVLANGAQSQGLTEIATAASVLASVLSEHAGAGPNADTADRGAAIFDPYVLIKLRTSVWSIQSLRIGATTRRGRTFLSYRRADSFPVVDRISREGGTEKELWLDIEQLRHDRALDGSARVGSKDWRLGLLAALHDSASIVIFFSLGYFRSPACLTELQAAALSADSRSTRITWFAVDGAACGHGEQEDITRRHDVDTLRELVRVWARLGSSGVNFDLLNKVLKATPAVGHLVSPFLDQHLDRAAKGFRDWSAFGNPGFD